MRLLFHLCGDKLKASSRVRGYWVGEELEALGHKVTFCVTKGKAEYLAFASRISKHDVVIFQKTYSRYDLLLAVVAKRLGKRVLFDLDDAPSRSLLGSTIARAEQMMRRADAVMVGSPALAKLASDAGAREVHLIPSGVRLADYRQIIPYNGSDQFCLGWLGNGAHYADDLISVLHDPIKALSKRYPLRLRIVGACRVKKLYEAFGGIEGLKTEFIDEVDWANPAAVCEAITPFDVGLYPLNPGQFNDFKCGFKAIEYMASGLPVVASRIAVNAEIVEEGITGYMTEDAESWSRALHVLVTNPDLRARMGAAGRASVEARFTTKRIALQVAAIAEGSTT